MSLALPLNLKNKLIEIEKTAVGEEAYKAASKEINEKCDAIANAVDEYIKEVLKNNLTILVPGGSFSTGAGAAAAPVPIPIPCDKIVL